MRDRYRVADSLRAVLIWLNGPNGVGKTQVAFALHRRLPGSAVCDPEHLGFGLRRMLPEALRTDFRDMPLWRQGVREVLSMALEGIEGPVIAPMTVFTPDTLMEILGPLRAAGHEVHHVTLLASKAVILRRIRSRGETSRSWAACQIDRTLEALQAPQFARHLHTDGMSVSAVVEDIARHIGADLEPDTDDPLTRRIRQLGVQLRHIRFD